MKYHIMRVYNINFIHLRTEYDYFRFYAKCLFIMLSSPKVKLDLTEWRVPNYNKLY